MSEFWRHFETSKLTFFRKMSGPTVKNDTFKMPKFKNENTFGCYARFKFSFY